MQLPISSTTTAAARVLTWLLLAIPTIAQAQFSFITNNGAITITGHTDSASETVVAIPGTINGLPVTSIGDRAFTNSVWLASVTIPEGVTNIGSSVFYHCFALTNASLPNPASARRIHSLNVRRRRAF
jgi:hypothetical protein